MEKYSLFITLTLASTMCSCNILYKFDKNEYQITYHIDEEIENNNPTIYTKDMGKVELNNPTKKSCTFKGWYKEPEYINKINNLDYKIKSNLDLYGKFAEGIVESAYNIDIGLRKEYTIYHISDTHINAGTTEYDLQNEENRVNIMRISYANSFKEEYDTNYLFKESKQCLSNLVDYLNNEKPYAVCYSGDIMDYYSEANYEFVKEQLGKTNAPYVYAMGNHETPVSNYENMPGVDSTSFTVCEFKEFEIICMDNSSGFYTTDQYNKLLNETKKKKKIIIVQHIPLLTENNLNSKLIYLDDYFWIKTFDSEENQKMVELICNNKYIKLVLCGHVHGEIESEIAPGKKQITCSSGLMGHINKIVIN